MCVTVLGRCTYSFLSTKPLSFELLITVTLTNWRALTESIARSPTVPASGDEESISGGAGGSGGVLGARGGDAASVGKQGTGGTQPLSRAQRLRQQSNMSFWLILKKKNDLQAKAARVQELRAMLEKIRLG